MPTFIMAMNWTEQGIRSAKEWPRRNAAARELAKKLNIEVKQVFLTSGDTDLLAILETPTDDNVAKFCMAIGAHGNVRTRTVRAWTEAELTKMVGELP